MYKFQIQILIQTLITLFNESLVYFNSILRILFQIFPPLDFIHYGNIYFLIFEKHLGNDEKSFLVVQVGSLGMKSSVLREHLATRRSSANTDPEEIVDGILLEKRAIRAINNGNLFLLSKSLYTKIDFYFDFKF